MRFQDLSALLPNHAKKLTASVGMVSLLSGCYLTAPLSGSTIESQGEPITFEYFAGPTISDDVSETAAVQGKLTLTCAQADENGKLPNGLSMSLNPFEFDNAKPLQETELSDTQNGIVYSETLIHRFQFQRVIPTECWSDLNPSSDSFFTAISITHENSGGSEPNHVRTFDLDNGQCLKDNYASEDDTGQLIPFNENASFDYIGTPEDGSMPNPLCEERDNSYVIIEAKNNSFEVIEVLSNLSPSNISTLNLDIIGEAPAKDDVEQPVEDDVEQPAPAAPIAFVTDKEQSESVMTPVVLPIDQQPLEQFSPQDLFEFEPISSEELLEQNQQALDDQLSLPLEREAQFQEQFQQLFEQQIQDIINPPTERVDPIWSLMGMFNR